MVHRLAISVLLIASATVVGVAPAASSATGLSHSAASASASGLTATGSAAFTQNTAGVPGTSEPGDRFGSFFSR